MSLQASGLAASGTTAEAPADPERLPLAAPVEPCPPQLEGEVIHGVLAHGRPRTGFWAMSIGSLGVVFGDIGTSPLYAFQAAMGQAAKDPVTGAAVTGVVSLALWALILVVTVKYVLFVMRADNKGEGGVLSLMALAQRALGKPDAIRAVHPGPDRQPPCSTATPSSPRRFRFSAPSRACRTCRRCTASCTPHEITHRCRSCILVGLFLFQSRGTASLASCSSVRVMVVWFFCLIAALAILHIVRCAGGPGPPSAPITLPSCS